MRSTACPSCTRRLRPQDPISPQQACRYLCGRCGTAGYVRSSDGALVWQAGGDGSVESRQARASWRHDGLREMKAGGASPLPGLGE